MNQTIKLVVLSGAGISAESGLKTFRNSNGLWEGHDVQKVATPEGFLSNPKLVLEFYNQRRKQLKSVVPNLAHKAIGNFEKSNSVYVITQNVDDLHERGGSSRVLHLHGELRKVRSTRFPDNVLDWDEDLYLGDTDEVGHQLRPHIVWFGEAVPLLPQAISIVERAENILIIGTSMQIYPAAGLIAYAKPTSKIIYLDPYPSINYELSNSNNLTIVDKSAVEGIVECLEML